MFIQPWVSVLLASVVMSYPSGPPETEFICKDMFPMGHKADAQFDDPPYEIDLSQTVYTPWDELRVTLRGTKGSHIAGFMMQARRANCSHQFQQEPLGTFQLMPDERYLKTISCNKRLNSSIAHRTNPGLQQAVFKWFAPAALLGDIYFVATVVKKQQTFWTTVYSKTTLHEINTRVGVVTHCPARILLDPNTGPQTTDRPNPITTESSQTGPLTTDRPYPITTESSQRKSNSDTLRKSITITVCCLIAAVCFL